MADETETGAPGDWAAPHVLHTDRLAIFPGDVTAAAEIAPIIADPLVHENYFAGRVPQHFSTAHAESWHQEADDWPRLSRFSLVARQRHDAVLIGGLQIMSNHVCYFVAPRFWGQGYGSEMAERCCRDLPHLLGLSHLLAGVIRENTGSRRILEKAGFVFDGLVTRPWTGRPGSVAMLRYKLDIHTDTSSPA